MIRETGHFNQLNAEQAQVDLKLLERATADGQKELPRHSRISKDSLAEDIDNYLNNAITLAKEKAQDRLQDMDAVTTYQSQGSQQQITEIFDAATSELKTTSESTIQDFFAAETLDKR